MSKLDELIKKLCPDGVEYKRLGEIGEFYGGLSGKSKKDFSDGNYPYISYMNVYQHISVLLPSADMVVIKEGEKQNRVQYGDILFTGSSETPEECGFSSVVTQQIDYPLYLNSFSFGLRLTDRLLLNPEFAKYVFRSHNVRKQIIRTANGVTRFNVSKSKMKNVRIPVPPLEVQSEIVKILDNFTELTTELTMELTTELTARKKQYEYYRNWLLTFESKDISLFKLQDVVEIQRGIRVTRNQLSNDGKYPVYQNSLVPMGYYNDKNREANSTFLICAGAAGDIGYSTQAFWAADDCYTFDCSDKILNRYLFYVLKNKQALIYSKVRRASVPRISKESIGTIKVPVPEISVQERIVNVLDNFDKVCNDLHIGLPAEIEARKKQYEFYRDSLLTFLEKGESILTEQNRTELRYALIKLLQYVFGYVWLPLSTISENLDSYRKPIKQGNRMKGIYPYYGASGIVDYVKDYIFDGNFLLVSEDGANLLARVTPIAFSISGKNWVNNHAHVLKFHDLYMQKYVEFYLNFLDLQSVISGAAQPKLTKNSLDKIKIPVPDEVVLKRIVSTLERFDTLCHDISSGLPAEIKARKKQYEYYRDKLLSFKEKKG